VVDAAAILGRRIPFDLLAAVTGSGEDELIAILRHLVAENVMVEEEPDLFAFRHALTREAIGGRLLGRERRRLHEKALAALQETGGGDWAAIAWHAQGAGRYEEMVEAAAPAPGATSSRARPPRRCGWPRPACPRPTTTWTCWPPPPRRPG
jgi:hypothetical protein